MLNIISKIHNLTTFYFDITSLGNVLWKSVRNNGQNSQVINTDLAYAPRILYTGYCFVSFCITSISTFSFFIAWRSRAKMLI